MSSTWGRGRDHPGWVFASLLVVVSAARAQEPTRNQILVPGTTKAVSRLLGLDPPPERASFMMEITRALYDQPSGVDASADEKLAALYAYLDLVESLESALLQLPGAEDELTLELAPNKNTRKALEQVAELLGLELVKKKNRYFLRPDDHQTAVLRRQLLADIGVDLTWLVSSLNAGGRESIEIAYESVPLPLSPTVWSGSVFEEAIPEIGLFRRIMSERRAALLYFGLSSLDDKTLAYLATNSELLRRIYQDHASNFSVFGRSIHIRDGRMSLRGDPRSQHLWTDLIDAGLDDVERFVRRLLGKDDGRLAYFYDTVTHLDEPHAAFALGLSVADAEEQRDRFRDLYRAFADTDDELNLKEVPFKRRAFDAAMLLREVVVTAEGLAGPPNWHRLWREAFGGEDLPGNPERKLRKLDPSEPVDAAWLVERICHQQRQSRQERFEMFLFAQRVFAEASLDEAPDILLALRGFVRHPTLMLTLERIGVVSPEVYATAARHAAELTEIDDARQADLALSQFQGALALVDRVRFARALKLDAVRELVRSLVSRFPEDERYRGRILDWVDDELLPALRAATGAPGELDDESVLLRALAGVGPESAESTAFQWEGMRFRVGYRESELERLREVRLKLEGNSLSQVMSFARGLDAVRAASSPAELKQRTRSLEALGRELTVLEEPGMEQVPGPSDARKITSKACERLLKITKGKDLDKVEAHSRPLVELSDEFLADALKTLVYAVHLGRADGPVLLTNKLARRHDFGLVSATPDERHKIAWQIPSEISKKEIPWHLRGSLLGLDLGLARLTLRRLDGAPRTRAPKLGSPDREAFTHVVALMNPAELRDADRDQLASAIRNGRERLRLLARRPDRIETVSRDAGLSEWRQQGLHWVLAQAPEQLDTYLSMSELFWLGRRGLPPVAIELDPWGTSALPRNGCYCLRFPSAEPWEDFSGRLSQGQLASRMPDLNLLVAERLAEWNLPASLAPAVLSFLVLDYVEEVQPSFSEDWRTLAKHVLTTPGERVQDYVSALVMDGPLTLVSDSSESREDQ